MSFRDDLRVFWAWDKRVGLQPSVVHAWASELLRRRYNVGGMMVEPSDDLVFTGLVTRWLYDSLIISPRFADLWAAVAYSDAEIAPIKPWRSWVPPSQQRVVVRGVLSRCAYFSSTVESHVQAFAQAICLLCSCAGYPSSFVSKHVREWASSWCPKGHIATPVGLRLDIERALSTAF